MSAPFAKYLPLAGVTRLTGGVFYGWWLVGLVIVIMTLEDLTVFQALGVFLVALERQFAWSRTVISGAFSLARAEGAALGPIEGYLIDRFGARRMIMIGYTTLGIGFLLLSGLPDAWLPPGIPRIWPLSGVEKVWQFYFAFIVITLGSGLGGWLALITLVNSWFIRRRSFAMAAASSGMHLAGFMIPLIAWGVDSHGFRWTTFGIGLFLLATVTPVTKLIRNSPEEYGLRPDNDPPSAPATRPGATRPSGVEPDFTAREALRTPAFWILTIVHLSSSVSIVTLALHLVPKLTDIGLSLTSASLVIPTYSLVGLVSQFVGGYLGDRVSKPRLLFVFLLLQATSVMVIAVAQNVLMAYIFAVLFGIGLGGRVPLLVAIRGDYFGRRAFGTIMGWSQLLNNLFMIGAPLFAGYMFDTTGDYFIPFTTFAVLNALGSVLVLFARKPEPSQVGLASIP